jgi:hypothetical protein
MKFLLTNLLSILLICNPIFAEQLTSNDNVAVQCNITGESLFFPIGDERGNSVFTKKEIRRDCNLTIKIKGPCKEWQNVDTNIQLKPSDYNSYRTKNYSESFGGVFSMISIYDQIGHFWSGWKGYCEKGWKTDFSWASDPMFWSSLAFSAIMEGSGDGGFADGSILDTDNISKSVGSAWEGLGKEVGMDLSSNFGSCLVSGGFSVGATLYSHFTSNSDDEECDPVDEFCEEKQEDSEQQGPFTISKESYQAFLEDNPEGAKYLEVLSEKNNILSVYFKPMSMTEGFDKKSENQIKKAKEMMKELRLKIGLASAALSMATCAGAGSTSNSYISKSDGRLSLRNGIGSIVGAIPADVLGPYGPLIKATLTVALQVFNSFKKINSCKDSDDASEAGSRHKKTQESIPYNLCIKTGQECKEEEFFGSNCGLWGYNYCCYDQTLTKVLVAQIKAQLGRDWAHCTGISLKDLQEYVKFKQCSETEKRDGFDGTKTYTIIDEDGDISYKIEGKKVSEIDRTQSFQYKHKCLDFTDIKEHIKKQVGEEVDFSDFDDIFKDMQNNIPSEFSQTP